MPKRTNPFQQLIHAIELQLHPEAHILESKFLPDWAIGDEREADIVIETDGDASTMRVIECRDHTRPQSIEWIDQMYGKHKREAHCLVLVSQSGFTASAKRKAKALGITTITFEEAKEVDWTQVAGKQTRVQVALAEIQVEGIAVFPPLNAACLDARTLQCVTHGEEVQGSVYKVALDILQTPTEIGTIMKTCSTPGKYFYPCIYQFPEGSSIIDEAGERHAIEQLKIAVVVEVKERLSVNMQHGSYDGTQVAYGSISYNDENGLLTVVETVEQPLSADLVLTKSKTKHSRDVKAVRNGKRKERNGENRQREG